jgi:S-adenosylmethionine synthetase
VVARTLSLDPYSRLDVNDTVDSEEISVKAKIKSQIPPDIDRLTEIIRNAVIGVGYNASWGYDINTVNISFGINQQSPNIDEAVSNGGAGDTITKVGFATDETPEYLPLPHVLVRRLAQRVDEAFYYGSVEGLGPDGKLNLAVVYEKSEPKYVSSVVVAAQHRDGIDLEQFRDDIRTKIIIPEIEDRYDESLTQIFVNPRSLFVYGGPKIDTGVKGKKDADHTYGNLIGHTGGSAYGKDSSKVDFHGLVTARWIAKSIVAGEFANVAKVELTYAMGQDEPLEISINTFGTSDIPESGLIDVVKRKFPLKPDEIIKHLGLRNPEFYPPLAKYFFGEKPI